MEQIKIQTCPICLKSDFSDYLKVPDHSISKEVFNLSKCNNCGFIITNPQPNQLEIGKYYQSENYISHSGTKKGIVNKAYHIVRNRAIKSKLNLLKKYSSVNSLIDYGCGQGYFLKYCIDNKVEAIGFEPDEKTRNFAAEINNLPVSKIENYEKKSHSVDVITMWHVLEHVPNFVEILNTHHSNIKENGILVIAVPNRNSFDAKYYKTNWAAYDVPRHLWHFTKQDIENVAMKTGFKLVADHPMIYDSFYVSMLSEKYKNGNIIKGGIIGLLSNIKGSLNKNQGYSSRIYILKKKTT